MTQLPQPVREELIRSGWHPGRRVPLADIRRELKLEGHTLTPAAEDFLAQYAGLRMRTRALVSGAIVGSFDFDAIGASSLPAHNIQRYEAAIRGRLTPIGFAFGETMTLMISATGAVYAAFDATLLHVGKGTVEAISALCENYDMPEIDGVDWDSPARAQ
ncbi:SUKH-3 domain-containing protein [Streptomyces sp. NPDC006990]|uniref:SUKH-3 domain-containing protein n=1 Tax=unclassified Streptomyces TaxID=2593676 RepID=UPI003453F205